MRQIVIDLTDGPDGPDGSEAPAIEVVDLRGDDPVPLEARKSLLDSVTCPILNRIMGVPVFVKDCCVDRMCIQDIDCNGFGVCPYTRQRIRVRVCETLVKVADILYENDLLSPQDRAIVALRKACEAAAEERDAAALALADEAIELSGARGDGDTQRKMATYLKNAVGLLQSAAFHGNAGGGTLLPNREELKFARSEWAEWGP